MFVLFIMDYYRIDGSYFVHLITWMPSCIVFEIVEYTYAKCIDCNHFLLQEFECNKCKIIRCQYHSWLNTSKSHCHTCFDENIYDLNDAKNSINIPCIILNCKTPARFGYKDSVYYCLAHHKNKHNIIEYNHCFTFSCFFRTNKINKDTGNSTCTKHMNSTCEYVYNYVKN